MNATGEPNGSVHQTLDSLDSIATEQRPLRGNRNEPSGRTVPSGCQTVFAELVVYAARGDAELAGGLALIAFPLAEDDLNHGSLALRQRFGKVAPVPD